MKPGDAFSALQKKAKAYPGAWEDHPWGETVFKVGKKIFVFMSKADGSFGLSCKLPQSSEAAITMFSFATPTGYGLGKSGWVTAHFEKKDDVPVGLFAQWLDESYAAVAPKRGAKAKASKSGKRSQKQRRSP